MSQSITIFHFDRHAVEKYWQDLLDDKFGITTLQWVPDLRKSLEYVLEEIKEGDQEAAFESIAEMDDKIVEHFSKRSYDDYWQDIEEPLKFWMKANTNKSFKNDFREDITSIDKEAWKAILSQPKNVEEVRQLLGQVDPSEYHIEITAFEPSELIDWFLKMKAIYDYSDLTGAEMVILKEDRSLSKFWMERQKNLWERARPILEELASSKSS